MALPDFEAWAIFAAVAERGSFTGAANMLGVSKATVSKAITRLETQLSTVLFHRTSRRISLSAAGAALLPNAQRIRAEGEAAVEAARDEAELLSGSIKLAAPMSFGLRALAPILPDFMALHPSIMIDVHLSDSQIDLVENGFDLALRIAALPDSSMRAIRLRTVQRHLLAAPSYLARHGTPTHPRDLSDHWGFIYANIATPELWHFTGPDGERVAVKPRPVMQTNNSDVIMPALVAGRGVALLPDFLCDDDLRNNRLVTLLPDWDFGEIALHIVMPPSPRRPARVEVLIEFLRTNLYTA